MSQFWILVWVMIFFQMATGVAFTQWYYRDEEDSQSESTGVTANGR